MFLNWTDLCWLNVVLTMVLALVGILGSIALLILTVRFAKKRSTVIIRKISAKIPVSEETLNRRRRLKNKAAILIGRITLGVWSSFILFGIGLGVWSLYKSMYDQNCGEPPVWIPEDLGDYHPALKGLTKDDEFIPVRTIALANRANLIFVVDGDSIIYVPAEGD